MAYDEELANRIRTAVQDEPNLTEMRMFGGLAFLVDGHLAVSAGGRGGLLLRVDPAETSALLAEPLVTRFEMHGRELDGWLRVDVRAVETDHELAHWVGIGLRYARALPPKR